MGKNVKIKWPKVLDYHDLDQRPLLKWIDLGNGTLFRISAFFVRGGRNYPRVGLQVSIEYKGSFFFSIDHPLGGSYVCKKLFLSNPDALIIADWLNAQLGHYTKQQGVYNSKYITEVEEYGLIGEHKIMPLTPEIIE